MSELPRSEEAPDLTKSTSSEVGKRNDFEVMGKKWEEQQKGAKVMIFLS